MNDFLIIALLVTIAAVGMCLLQWTESRLIMARRYQDMRRRIADWTGRPPR